MDNKIIIYQGADKSIEVRLDSDRDTVWLSQEQMVQLFGRDQSVISRHLNNVFKEKELARKSNMQKMHIANSDKPVAFYNLDVIISVGYRVKSQQGTCFRQWATRILKEHLTQGWTLSRQRFETNARELEAALLLVQKAAQSQELQTDIGRGLVDIVTRYARTFLLLQRYDEGLECVEISGDSKGRAMQRLNLRFWRFNLDSIFLLDTSTLIFHTMATRGAIPFYNRLRRHSPCPLFVGKTSKKRELLCQMKVNPCRPSTYLKRWYGGVCFNWV